MSKTLIANLLGSEYKPVISDHDDEIRDRGQSFENHARLEDYLNSFNQFIKT